jgi:hypothetical protein
MKTDDLFSAKVANVPPDVADFLAPGTHRHQALQCFYLASGLAGDPIKIYIRTARLNVVFF